MDSAHSVETVLRGGHELQRRAERLVLAASVIEQLAPGDDPQSVGLELRNETLATGGSRSLRATALSSSVPTSQKFQTVSVCATSLTDGWVCSTAAVRLFEVVWDRLGALT